MTTYRNNARRAFTLVEMLTAVAITLIMLVLVGQLFQATSEAVSTGTQTSDIIANARAMSEQFVEDAELMVGPHWDTDPDGSHSPASNVTVGPGDAFSNNQEGGVLVILQRQLTGVPVRKPIDDPSEIAANRDGYNYLRNVRSDQIMFIRQRGDAWPLSPSGEGDFTSTDGADSGQVRHLKVWYGHVRRCDPDNWSNGSHDDGRPSNPDRPNQTDALGRTGLNNLANQWILGRQAVFLFEANSDMNNWSGTTALPGLKANGSWYNVGPRQTSGGQISRVTGYASWTPDDAQYMYLGITDVAYHSYDEPAPTSIDHPHGAMIGLSSPIGDHDNYTMKAGSNKATYLSNALIYTYGIKRLRVVTRPEPAGADLYRPRSYQFAQLHPYFAGNVSDFIVDFAADLDRDGDIDRDATTNAIIWYAGAALAGPANDPGEDDTVAVPSGTWATDVMSDLRSDTSVPHADYAFVFRHDDDPTNATQNEWPYLIRFRWRMHDDAGRVRQADGQHGRWFEQVIAVPRP